jgi:hypothetical protein
LEYLESQKTKAINSKQGAANYNANVDLLEQNLDFTAARIEQLDDRIDFLIVPIKDELITKKKLDKNSTLTLLLITDKLGKISSGSIVYFLPSDNQKHALLPQNTFSNMFTQKKVVLDGMYKMLTPSGRWISQFGIKNGKLVSYGEPRPSNKAGKINQKTTTCIDWYLITTYYYTDGTIEETKEYLGTTCGDCISTDGYAYFCQNPDGSGGGGGTSDPDPNQPENIESVQEVVSESTSSSTDIGSGPSPNGGELFWAWQANVSYTYNKDTKVVYENSIVGTKPFAVPGSNSVVDYYGNLSTVYHTVESSIFTYEILTYKSFRAKWQFKAIETWSPSGYTHDWTDYLSKVCGPL